MSQTQALIDLCRALTAVAIAEIDLSGRLLDANAGFLRLLPAGGRPVPGIAVAPSLISPSFARLIDLSSSDAGTIYEGLMTLGEPIGQSCSLRGTVSRTARGLFLLLQFDVEELSHVAETALELAGELAKAQRELLTTNNQLKLKEAERAQSEHALAQEAIRRRILVEQSSDGIVVLDEDGLVFEANQRFGEMLGYTPLKLSRLHVWDWDAQWTREELLRMLRGMDESGGCFETRHRRKDGTYLDMEISANGRRATDAG